MPSDKNALKNLFLLCILTLYGCSSSSKKQDGAAVAPLPNSTDQTQCQPVAPPAQPAGAMPGMGGMSPPSNPPGPGTSPSMPGMPGMGGSANTGAGGAMPGMPGMTALSLVSPVAGVPTQNCAPAVSSPDKTTANNGGGMVGPAAGTPGTTPIPAVKTNALYVVNGKSATISVIDPATTTVIGTIKLTNLAFPHHINLSPDRSALVVAVPGMDMSGGHDGGAAGMKGTLLLLDPSTGAVRASRVLPAMNHNGVFSPDGSEIWTTQMTAPGSVLVLDSKTLATKQQIAVGDMPAEVTFGKNGSFAFIANGGSNTVTVIDAVQKTVVRTVAVGKDPVGAWTGVDGVMYADNEQGKSVTAIDSKTLAVLRTYNLGFTPGMAITSPTGELWVSDADNGKITYYMAGMVMAMGDIATGAGAHGIAFSPDGTKAFVTNQMAGSVSVIDVQQHTLIKNLTVGENPNGLVYRSN